MPVRPAALFVILVWAGMLFWAHVFIGTSAEKFPIGDETGLWQLLAPLGGFTWMRVLQPHNEHFIPLPKFIEFVLYRLTGDLRPAMFLQAEILGAVSLTLILVARRLRGRMVWTDAVFPLLLLHTGNAANLLNGFQLALTLPTALASVILVLAATSSGLPRPSRALAVGLGLVGLPLCGGAGLAQVPALAAWLGWLGWQGIRSTDRSNRSGGRILLASVGMTFVAGAANVLWVRAVRLPLPPPRWDLVVPQAVALLSLGMGPAAIATWPASACLVLSLCAVTIGMLVGRLRRDPARRARSLGFLASMTATASLSLAASLLRGHLGWQNGFSLRYVTLTSPLLCGIYLAWIPDGGKLAGTCVRTILVLLGAATLPIHARIGHQFATEQRADALELENLIRRGARASEILGCFSERFHVKPAWARRVLQAEAEEHLPPFDVEPPYPPALFDFLPMDRLPASIDAEVPPAIRTPGGSFALLVRAGTRIHFRLDRAETRLSARFEIPQPLVDRHLSSGVRVLIQLAPKEGGLLTLYQRDLDPAVQDGDRGGQDVELEIPSHGDGEILLCTESLIEDRADRSWMYWTDFTMR